MKRHGTKFVKRNKKISKQKRNSCQNKTPTGSNPLVLSLSPEHIQSLQRTPRKSCSLFLSRATAHIHITLQPALRERDLLSIDSPHRRRRRAPRVLQRGRKLSFYCSEKWEQSSAESSRGWARKRTTTERRTPSFYLLSLSRSRGDCGGGVHVWKRENTEGAFLGEKKCVRSGLLML